MHPENVGPLIKKIIKNFKMWLPQQSILGTRPSVTAQANIPTKLTLSAVISLLTRLSLFEGKGEDRLFEH